MRYWLAELDEMRVAPWHFCPALSDTGSTEAAAACAQ
jgi:hypothetical protein